MLWRERSRHPSEEGSLEALGAHLPLAFLHTILTAGTG